MKTISCLLGSFFLVSGFCLNSLASAPLLHVSENFKNGVQTIFIEPTTTFNRSTVMIDATVDGSNVNLEHPGENLWIYPVAETPGLTHSISFKVSLGNKAKVAQADNSIASIAEEITATQIALAAATSPDEIARLNAQLIEKQRIKMRLEADRENLKNFIGNQNFYFQPNS